MLNDVERHFEIARLKKSRRWWRVGAVLLALLVLAALLLPSADREFGEPHIARLRIDGLITGNEKTLKLIRDVKDDAQVKAAIIRIDSPGGTTAGSEALYEEIRKLGKEKPVVAVMDSLAASGGYITALAADHIVARGNTLTGSIGVIFSYPEISKLLDTVGVKMEEIKSGDLKAEPSGSKPISPKALAVSEAMIQDSFTWFLGLVEERRKIANPRTATLADGRVFTGRQALKENLVDELGGEDQAIAWLEKEKSIAKDIPVLTWRPREPFDPLTLIGTSSGWLGRALGLEPTVEVANQASAWTEMRGLLVLWKP